MPQLEFQAAVMALTLKVQIVNVQKVKRHIVIFRQTQPQYCSKYTAPIVNNICLWSLAEILGTTAASQ